MVQFVRAAPNLSKMFQADIGQQLGQGLSNFMNNYLAGKAVDDVTNSQEFKNSPIDQQLSILETKTRPFGEVGQNLLQRRAGILQQEQKQKELDRQKKISPIIQKIQKGQQPTEEELQLFTPQEMLNLAKIQSQQNIANIRAQNKLPPGGLSGQPVPFEVSEKMNKVLQENPGANSDQLNLAMDKAGVPRAYSNSVIENRRRQDEASPKERLEIHKLTQDFSKKLNEDAESAKKRIRSFDVMEKALKSGKTDPRLFKNMLANAFGGTYLEGLLRDPESEEFKAASFNVYEGLKNVFGTRLSDADLKLASTKVPDITKKPESNKKIIDFLKFADQMNVEKQKVADQIIKENRGYRPIDFEQQLRDRIDSKFGKEAEEKLKEVADSERKELSDQQIDEYLRKANFDVQKAKELAKQDGYELK